jgi:hypothetical protein
MATVETGQYILTQRTERKIKRGQSKLFQVEQNAPFKKKLSCRKNKTCTYLCKKFTNSSGHCGRMKLVVLIKNRGTQERVSESKSIFGLGRRRTW